MMHTRLEKTVPVKAAPQPDCRKPWRVRQPPRGKIYLCFLRQEIDIGKNRDSGDEVLEDLSAQPASTPA